MDTAAFPYPPELDAKAANKTLGFIRRSALEAFHEDFGSIELARHVLAGAGSTPAKLPKGSLAAERRDEDGAQLAAGGGEPAPCRLRMFRLDPDVDGPTRVAIACAVWEGAEPAHDWALWRVDMPKGLPPTGCFLRMGDWDDAELLAERIWAAAAPHPEALARLRSPPEGAGGPLCEAAATLRGQAWRAFEASQISEAALEGASPARARL